MKQRLESLCESFLFTNTKYIWKGYWWTRIWRGYDVEEMVDSYETIEQEEEAMEEAEEEDEDNSDSESEE